ncbi:MAG: hypothetical protein K6357_02310 [Elusimicrobiota bacterium]
MAKFKLCLDCGYKNDISSNKCLICLSNNIVIKEEKRKYYFLILFTFLLVVSIFYLFNNTKPENIGKIEKEVPLFVSEKRPINYYTYLKSIENIGEIEPDEDDEKAVLRAFKYNIPQLSSAALKTLKKWYKKTANEKYRRIILEFEKK